VSVRGIGVDGESLCEHCRFMREVVSGRGSRFLLCQVPGHDRRFPKYPPQPVVRCAGYADWEEEGEERTNDRPG
jgi:hypothetical protein